MIPHRISFLIHRQWSGESETIFDVGSVEGAELGTWDSGGLGTLEGCGDGEADSVLVVGSLEGVELGPQLTEEEGETLNTGHMRFSRGRIE